MNNLTLTYPFHHAACDPAYLVIFLFFMLEVIVWNRNGHNVLMGTARIFDSPGQAFGPQDLLYMIQNPGLAAWARAGSGLRPVVFLGKSWVKLTVR